MGLFGAAHGRRERELKLPALAQNLLHKSNNDETWHGYTLPKEDQKKYKQRDTLLSSSEINILIHNL